MNTIDTERLILRNWQLEDLDDLYEYAKDPRVGPMSGWEPHSNKEASLNALKYYMKNDNRWAIVLKENKKVIGSLKITTDENRGKFDAKYISYVLSAYYWGNGYMTEAVKRVIKYVFEEMHIDMLSAFYYPHNSRSKRVLEKCGFKYETTIKNSQKIYDGKVFDAVCYSILKSDYYITKGEL